MTKYNLIKIVTMWDKINELSRQSLSQMQIALQLGISRDTVRRYQRMSAAEVNDRLHKEFQRRRRKLDAYEEFIKNQLQSTQFLSAPQIHDRLKEHFPDLPYVCERTVYSMVQRVRDTEDLPKIAEPVRQMAKVPDCEYGEKAQVDFGEKWLKSGKGQQVKVYFFAMALQRSRYKFIYLQNIPFTAKTVVYAHHLAFKYFGGMPKMVIYDQDKKILVSENYGDYVMTDEFARFVAAAHFEPVFCMPADPASKGLIENVVKYVKGNFLAGRTYVNISTLNEEAIGWLERTGNAKVNSSTRLVPAEEYKEERKHLLPYTLNWDEPEVDAKEYNVRKDNTLLYHSNYYSLPLGTYTGPGSKVLVVRNVDLNELEIYDQKDFSLITRHDISPLKGKYISKEGHASSKSRDILESERILREFFGEWDENTLLSQFLDSLRTDRPRYYSKNVTAMASTLTDYDKDSAHTLLEMYSEMKVYNANTMKEIARDLADRMLAQPKVTPIANLSSGLSSQDIMPEKRSMSEYADIIEGRDE